ncbi:hypothetical protein D915_008201 [Fasciola hepatica]|uniref:Uncharacterized protein n=1 Tax=Fasciola hepatica TaxID=6192 RepID=A0A4E0R3V0_FASHE|nr:hypothetical protein D915_008201 [Fasciola hepatica]
MTKCQFEEQLAREAAGITGLKTTLAARRTEIRQLKTRISELNTEKQELLSQLLATKSALSQSNSLWRSTEGTQRSRLLTALLQTVDEMKRLSNQLSKMAEGQRPDLASLLFEPKPLSDWSNSVADFNVSASPRDDADLITAPGSPLTIPRNMCFGHQQSPFPECDLRTQAEQVQNIYEQLAELRKHLADRYAEHLGGKLDCFVQ